MADCVFCKMVSGEIPVEQLAFSPTAIIIKDRQPQAATHLLVISRFHTPSFTEAAFNYPHELAKCLDLAADYAAGYLPNGYRLVTNVGEDAGQIVKHLHFHILGGEKLKGI